VKVETEEVTCIVQFPYKTINLPLQQSVTIMKSRHEKKITLL